MFRILIVFSVALWPATEDPAAPVSTPIGADLEHSWDSRADTLTANGRRRVERLLETRVACLGCHTLNGEGGAIGPTLDGVGTRLSRTRIRAMITDPQNTLPGSMMPAQPLSPRDVALLTDYLADDNAWSGAETPVALSSTPAATDLPAPELYERHCSSCHGIEGAGDGWNAGNLPVAPTAHSDPALMSPRADDTLYDAIHAGGWVLDRSPQMPAFGDLLSPEQIRLLIGYIRELCDCSGPSWSTRGGSTNGGTHDR